MHYDTFLQRAAFAPFTEHFKRAIKHRSDPARHGDLAAWLKILSALPNRAAQHLDFNQASVQIGARDEVSETEALTIQQGLFALSPWRKGPFSVFGTAIDTEWRSDWKWQRVVPHIQDLTHRNILDVGCGSGYHCWRMLGAGAQYVLGIDPSMRFQIQHRALQKFAQCSQFDMLPIGIEDLPTKLCAFDTVFSMGVLYHRKDPLAHVKELFNLLNPSGQLILETLIVDEGFEPSGIFTPADRYAQMRNVWSITTINKTLELLEQAGFLNPRCVDVNITSLHEQRQTEWMAFHSLAHFLDPNDQTKTIEGYPAPTRAIFVAEKQR